MPRGAMGVRSASAAKHPGGRPTRRGESSRSRRRATAVLSADALRAIYAYLRSIPEPAAMADNAILR
jgi:hypothetical protein